MVTIGSQGKLIAVLVGVLVLAGASIGAIMLLQQSSPGPSIDVIKKDGTRQTITLSQMLSMESVEAYGAYENSYGNPRGNGTYKGVNVSNLIDLAGGMESTDRIVVNASDGYSITFPYEKVYPSPSIHDLQGDMILAYSYNGTTAPEWEQGLRIIFLPEDEYYSNADANATTPSEYFGGAAGPQCVSNVVTIEIVEPVLSITVRDETTSYSMSELLALPSITGEGGYRKTTGTIVGPYNYTGVTIQHLLELSGTLPVEYSIEAVASDLYTTYFNRTEVEGALKAYDAETGDPLGIGDFTVILAYHEGGEPLVHGGPLRIVTLSEDGYLSDGHYWAKDVVNITLLDEIEHWSLELRGVEEWNMTHDIYYSLASCPHHHVEFTLGESVYAGVPLWTIIASMDGGDDNHYLFNTTLLSRNYNVTLFSEDGANVTFSATQLAYNSSIIVAGWVNGTLLQEPDWPLKLVVPEGVSILGNIVRIEMTGWDD
jgi:hypothetical protein